MLRHYILVATKVLLRRKFFTFISLFGVAFTLVVLVTIAAFFDHALAAEAPETRLERMLAVHGARMWGQGNRHSGHAGFKLFDRYARNLPGVEHLTVYAGPDSVSSFVNGQKVTSYRKQTDAEFWRVFEFTFVEGRPYDSREVDEAAFVAVLTASARDRLLGPGSAVGKSIEADGQHFRVVGVVSDVSIIRFAPFADVWVPTTTAKTDRYKDGLMGNFHAVALATSPGNLDGLRDEFNSRLRRVELPTGFEGIVAPFETKFEMFARQMSLADFRDDSSQAGRLVLLLAFFGILFALLPTVNLVNINVSRIMERASEIGVRKAFGASSRTLVGQFIVENVLLTLAGLALAFVLSYFVLQAINTSGLIPHSNLRLNGRVFAVGVALALAFGVISGVYPAWRMSRLRPVEALKGVAR